ncbi:rCG27729 [Rattus norvegicus]|uniref:RCG27729 n=1 Tax=Rattus norvegicus TaxID=10116 RepID=A6KBP9_RAT|nr:rCG27729 [Rattus norvegicus]
MTHYLTVSQDVSSNKWKLQDRGAADRHVPTALSPCLNFPHGL